MADVKLEAQLDQFEANLKRIEKLTDEVCEKILEAGAAAFATTAAKYTPPAIGKAKIPEIFYEDGIVFGGVGIVKPFGRRIIIDLLETARARMPLSPWAGKLLRKGFYYYVTSARGHYSGARKVKIYCKTIAEAKRYARETHRGSLRAAWGLSFGSVGMKTPAAFKRLQNLRANMTDRGSAERTYGLDKTITLINAHQDARGSWTANMESKAYFNSLKTMNRKIERFLAKEQKA